MMAVKMSTVRACNFVKICGDILTAGNLLYSLFKVVLSFVVLTFLKLSYLLLC